MNEYIVDVDKVTVRFNKASENIDNLKEYFVKLVRHELMFKEFLALKDVDLKIRPGEAWAIIGTNGSGKSTLLKVISRILKPYKGSVKVNGKDIDTLTKAQWKNLRREMQVVYQDPYGSLDPRMTVGQLISEPLDIHHLYLNKQERKTFLEQLVTSVGLSAQFLNRYPHEFSGGQRQRICIARALALNPSILIADEPVSALDVSVQAQILNLLKEIKQTRQLSMLFVTHDFGVARFLCDDIAVMYQGQIVEFGPSETVLTCPQHAYTKRLLAAVPKADPSRRGEWVL